MKIGDIARPYLIPNGVYAGYLHIAHTFEKIPFGTYQLRHIIFVVEMNHIVQIVFCAPIGLNPKEIFTEQSRPDIPVIRPDPADFVGQMRREK